MMDPPHIVAGRLKALRIELGYKSQTAFAEKLGIDKSTYNPYEKGTRPLTFETACLIRRRFGVSIDWLFFGDMRQASRDLVLKLGPEPGMADAGLAKDRRVERPAKRAGGR